MRALRRHEVEVAHSTDEESDEAGFQRFERKLKLISEPLLRYRAALLSATGSRAPTSPHASWSLTHLVGRRCWSEGECACSEALFFGSALFLRIILFKDHFIVRRLFRHRLRSTNQFSNEINDPFPCSNRFTHDPQGQRSAEDSSTFCCARRNAAAPSQRGNGAAPAPAPWPSLRGPARHWRFCLGPKRPSPRSGGFSFSSSRAST